MYELPNSIEIVDAQAVDLTADLEIYSPRFKAIKQLYLNKHDFGAGHLTAIGVITMVYLLQGDPTRILTPDSLQNIDAVLCAYFGNCEIGKL